jgi:hypothetical protein
LGARYLDVRISASREDPSHIYLAHTLLSNVRLEEVLTVINTFMRTNPDEIIILDISNDFNPDGQVGQQVP